MWRHMNKDTNTQKEMEQDEDAVRHKPERSDVEFIVCWFTSDPSQQQALR